MNCTYLLSSTQEVISTVIKVKLWSLGKDDNNNIIPVSVDEIDKTETENQLENILVNNPELLMPGLRLVGRQTPTEGGPLDLLGIGEDGSYPGSGTAVSTSNGKVYHRHFLKFR